MQLLRLISWRRTRRVSNPGSGRFDGPAWTRASRAFWLVLLLTVPANYAAPLDARTEEEIKATWLLNFAKFIEWPATTWRQTNAAFVVGHMAPEPLGSVIDRAFQGKSLRGRPVELRHLGRAGATWTGVQVLYLGAVEPQRQTDVLASTRSQPILTVGESEGFLEKGGIIQFVRRGSFVRFKINLGAARAAGLKISPKLLEVAIDVKRSEP